MSTKKVRDTTLLLTGYIVIDRKTLRTISEVNPRKENPRAWSYVQVFPSRSEALAWRRTNAPGREARVISVVIVAPVDRAEKGK